MKCRSFYYDPTSEGCFGGKWDNNRKTVIFPPLFSPPKSNCFAGVEPTQQGAFTGSQRSGGPERDRRSCCCVFWLITPHVDNSSRRTAVRSFSLPKEEVVFFVSSFFLNDLVSLSLPFFFFSSHHLLCFVVRVQLNTFIISLLWAKLPPKILWIITGTHFSGWK